MATMIATTNPNCPIAIIANHKLSLPIEACPFVVSPEGRGRVRVRLISASNLVSADANGYSDPYIKIKSTSIDSMKVTRVIEKNLNPVWDEEVSLDISSVGRELLIIDVYDHDLVGNDDLLGFVGIDLSLLPLGIEVLTCENLSFAKHGTIQIGITALDFGLTNIPPNYLQAYTQWRNGLPGYQKKEFKKLKKHKDSHGPYVNKVIHEDYKLVNGFLKRKKNKREKTAKGFVKGLKVAGKVTLKVLEHANDEE
ncbi:hypothetical protein RB653_010107 [Dictyostelium firmibasis]|uniref:C2 domain-containing protein n=1 Tax=Dictyostelium firmibasis TaxID=79012 RepID=A0AAN7TTI2_9MYCE